VGAALLLLPVVAMRCNWSGASGSGVLVRDSVFAPAAKLLALGACSWAGCFERQDPIFRCVAKNQVFAASTSGLWPRGQYVMVLCESYVQTRLHWDR